MLYNTLIHTNKEELSLVKAYISLFLAPYKAGESRTKGIVEMNNNVGMV
jgi:hypothetical protein